jgi:transposase
MKYVGADLHKNTITLCVVELVDGKIRLFKMQKLLCKDTAAIEAFFAELGEFSLTVEATIGYDWFAALAERYSKDVQIAHAGKLRIIAESTKKTDKVDARILAEFLAKDMIPLAWRPTPRVRQYRSLVRRRRRLSSRVTSIRNTIRGILTRYNSDRKDAFTREGAAVVKRSKLLREEKWIIRDLYDDLADTKKRLAKYDKRLVAFGTSATTKEKEARAVLATFPQFGPITTDVILAELGDWTRFKNGSAVVAFAGLAPGVRSSDNKRKNLRITKAGSPLLRWILIQLAQRLKIRSARWNRIYTVLAKRVGNKKATCALARRLLLTIYAMLRDGRAYELTSAA